ncbi:hypothetical protein GCM10010145_47100 [Streptomyces ruber]|uniref:SapB/AmfS family lantipeptide n=2 Tax=Streptomyces TaxID=1883 RepID=A0A918ETX8_9ACTN|nr:SapB/AmfS family lanthipeptide [Streptomyces ruber]GGQ72095.1 hypothetical protein GCM10010145_47100 [Streptomyces ruber]
MSMYDLQGMEAHDEPATTMASEVSWWSCGNNRPSDISLFACG